MQTEREKWNAFSIIEMIFIISIIGILLTILFPAMGTIKLAARKVKDVSHLKKIAEAWRECSIERGWKIDGSKDETVGMLHFAEQLAGRDRGNISDMVLNDPYVYISSGDQYASKVKSETVCYLNDSIVTGHECFSPATNFMTSDGIITSYCFMVNLPASVPSDTTPLGFTRGLCENGKWDEKSGLYGAQGGYVVYADGHVTWFDGDKPVKFLRWDKSNYTSNICEAVPSSTVITCGDVNTCRVETSDGSAVILHSESAAGT
ncbi:MAG: hypothetical protein LBB11_02780 [Puniceicoccales bacterium]|jgi:hypothetical protein|nr:hypothetical protein [Puniceicoccales bacterium]